MDNIVFNKNIALLQDSFPDQLIPLKDAAAYLGCDKRTLAAKRDFPLINMGNSKFVALVSFAKWLTVAGGGEK